MRLELMGMLPAAKLQKKKIAYRQDVPIIMKQVCDTHNALAWEYDLIADKFADNSNYKIAQKLFDFCKLEMKYKAESDRSQTVRSPAAILKSAKTWGVDCKHYASFIGGVLDALKRQGYPVNWCYRFASYDKEDPTPGHVFVVLNNGEKNIFIDPVLNTLDSRNPKYYWSKDKYPGMLYTVNGVPKRGNKVGLVQADFYLPSGGSGTLIKQPVNRIMTISPQVIKPITPIDSQSPTGPSSPASGLPKVHAAYTPAQIQTLQASLAAKKDTPWLLYGAIGLGLFFMLKSKKK